MTCPECQKRPAKRACPALHRDICAVCCATKRRVEIACPEDCAHLDRALRHPSATVKRQLDRDVALVMATMGRLSEEQLQVFFLIQSVVLAHKPAGLGRLADSDLALAAGALAGSLETASRGVIFEEPTASIVAESLRKEMKALVDDLVTGGGSRAERQVAEVLRGIERGASHEGAAIGDDPAGYLALVARVLQQRVVAPAAEPPRPLIITP